MTSTRRHRAAGRRGYEQGSTPEYVRPDETCWFKPEAVSRPITLPAISMSAVTDTDIGLPEDLVAQNRAERWLLAAYAQTLRDREKAKEAARQRMAPGMTVHAELPDNSLVMIDPTDILDVEDLAILAELRRLTDRPRCQWMQKSEPESPAS